MFFVPPPRRFSDNIAVAGKIKFLCKLNADIDFDIYSMIEYDKSQIRIKLFTYGKK